MDEQICSGQDEWVGIVSVVACIASNALASLSGLGQCGGCGSVLLTGQNADAGDLEGSQVNCVPAADRVCVWSGSKMRRKCNKCMTSSVAHPHISGIALCVVTRPHDIASQSECLMQPGPNSQPTRDKE